MFSTSLWRVTFAVRAALGSGACAALRRTPTHRVNPPNTSNRPPLAANWPQSDAPPPTGAFALEILVRRDTASMLSGGEIHAMQGAPQAEVFAEKTRCNSLENNDLHFPLRTLIRHRGRQHQDGKSENWPQKSTRTSAGSKTQINADGTSTACLHTRRG